MIRIFYLSKAADGVTVEDHQQILSTARRFNREHGITGLLVVKDGYFAQALEGEPEEVESLYERIKHDRRHSGVVMLSKTEADHRMFSDWEMGYRNLDEMEACDQFAQIDLADKHFVERPEELSLIFRSFVEE